MGEPEDRERKREKALSVQSGTRTLKTSGFGQSGVIPHNDRCVAGGGERKPPLITHYRSRKSTAQNVCMASDLEGLDRTTENAPDGGSGIDRELSHILEGI